MTNPKQWLNQPYPFSAEPNAVWRESLFGGLFVLFFLFIFQPFGLSYPSGRSLEWLQVCAEYGSVTFVVSVIWGSAIRRLPQIFSEATWTVRKEIVSTLVFVSLIATANYLSKVFAPIERVLGVTLLGMSVVRTTQNSGGQNGNFGNNFP